MSKDQKKMDAESDAEHIDLINQISQLKKENFQLRNLIENLPGDIYWKDKDGVWSGVNKRGEESLHRMGLIPNNHDVIGKTDFELFSQETAEIYRKNDLEVMNKQIEITKEEINQLPTGETIVQLSTKRPLWNENGEVVGIVGNTVDISYLKKIEEELRIAKEKAEVASQAKDDFISDMEHDLRTPFTGIGGMANLLYSMSEEKYPEFSELLKIMMTSCEKWEEVHQRIFNVLVVEQITPLNIEPVSISKEVKEIQDMEAAILYSKNIQCILEPVPIELDLIETDALKLHLVLSNLISNAIKFTEKGNITVNVSQDNNYRIIKVMDTGIGIPDDKFEYIFEKFTKLSRSNTHGGDFKGVGVGLYVAKAYANQLGATIDVESEVGKGSTFSIKLPKSGIRN